ncbi:MAG: HAMP domain-containing sensor histidine kinase [Halofilum sp. (in: g-proteobacteria)]
MRPIRRLLKSSTFRIALIYMVLFAGSVAALLGFVYYATAGYLSRQTDAAIATEAAELAGRFQQGNVAALAREISTKAAANIGQRSVYLLADENLSPIAGNINRWPEEVQPDQGGWLEFSLSGTRGGPDPVRARQYRVGPDSGLHLLIGRNISAQQSFQRVIGSAMAWGVAISLGLAIVGGLLMSRTIARRLERTNRTAHAVMAGNLQQRVPTRESGDEFDRLGDNLNRMLDQIQYLMEGIRQVSDNVAHDLRTPLTRMRWRLERLQAGDDPDGDLLEQSIADADSLLNTFHALLRIAEVESGSRRRFTEVDASELIADVGELYEPVAAAHDQTLHIEADAPVHLRGDRDLLFQALTNLVDNAVKYTPAGGTLTLRVAEDGDHAAITVADSGPGVPADQRDEVLQRFVRLEAHRSSAGSGLGLSLVAAVARLHDGSLQLDDNGPGLRVRLLVPCDR